METTLNNATPDREENHVALKNAIYEMEHVILKAQELLHKIVGIDDNIKSQSENTLPTLSEVLAGSSETIRGNNAKLCDILGEISNALF